MGLNAKRMILGCRPRTVISVAINLMARNLCQARNKALDIIYGFSVFG